MESDLEVDGASEFVAAEVVSANYGVVLGVPALGRWFTSLNGTTSRPARTLGGVFLLSPKFGPAPARARATAALTSIDRGATMT